MSRTRTRQELPGNSILQMRAMFLKLLPSPPWGRGWRATGVITSRGETGEGVKTVAPNSNLTQCILVLTPSPTALRSPLSPKGAREDKFLFF